MQREKNDDLAKRLILAGLYTLNSSCTAASSANNPTTTSSTGKYAVVDTNQTYCYNSTTGNKATCAGAGYDGDYTGTYQPGYTDARPFKMKGVIKTGPFTGVEQPIFVAGEMQEMQSISHSGKPWDFLICQSVEVVPLRVSPLRHVDGVFLSDCKLPSNEKRGCNLHSPFTGFAFGC